jgi:hypothetical protein
VWYGKREAAEKSFLENIGLALRQKPSWCLSLQAILAPFGFVISNDPQPFGTDFAAELEKQSYRELYELFSYHHKNKIREIQHS